jgi:hypothetical protein
VQEIEQTPHKMTDEGRSTFDDTWKRDSMSKLGSTRVRGDARLPVETTVTGLSTVPAAVAANAERGASRAESANRITVFRIASSFLKELSH